MVEGGENKCMKKMINKVKKYKFWILLCVGFCSMWVGIHLFFATLSIVYFVFGSKMPYVVAGYVLFWFACRMFQIAYESQDEAWYFKNYMKTGDDFECRYEETFRKDVYAIIDEYINKVKQ